MFSSGDCVVNKGNLLFMTSKDPANTALSDKRVRINAAEAVAVVGVATPPPPEPSEGGLVTVGPVTVTRSTAGALKGLLAGSLALNVVFAVVMGLVLLRRRRAGPPDEAEAPTP